MPGEIAESSDKESECALQHGGQEACLREYPARTETGGTEQADAVASSQGLEFGIEDGVLVQLVLHVEGETNCDQDEKHGHRP